MGGSAWSNLSGWSEPDEYLHGGISILWSLGAGKGGRLVAEQYVPMSHGFQAGVFVTSSYKAENDELIDKNIGFYVCYKFLYGGNCY